MDNAQNVLNAPRLSILLLKNVVRLLKDESCPNKRRIVQMYMLTDVKYKKENAEGGHFTTKY